MNRAGDTVKTKDQQAAASIIQRSNCVVTPSMITLTVKGVDETSLFWCFTRRERIKTNLLGVASILRNGLARLPASGNYYHVFNIWGTGYYHWLTEIAPKFFMFEDEVRAGKFLLPGQLPKYIREFLDLFEFNQTVPLNKCLFAPHLNIVTNPTPVHHERDYIQRIRNRVRSKLGISLDSGYRKLYISRRSAARRKVSNEEDVVQLLAGRGYQCLELEGLSFAEQVKLFAECESLVTIHGAAISNAMFMPVGSRVIELYPKTVVPSQGQINACFQSLCQCMGVRHEFVFCERTKGHEPFSFHLNDLTVNLVELSTAIR